MLVEPFYSVVAALLPTIRVFRFFRPCKTRVPGTRTGMTSFRKATQRVARQAIVAAYATSFGPHSRSLDDRAPLLIVGMDHRVEFLWRTADRGSTQRIETIFHGGRLQRGDKIARQLRHDVGRHAG